MALDFHRLDTQEYLFGLIDEQYDCLSPIFETFQQWTGLVNAALSASGERYGKFYERHG
jgi:hypothetical protein